MLNCFGKRDTPLRESQIVEGDLVDAFRHTGIYSLHLQARATLGTERMRKAIQPPLNTDENKWILAKTIGVVDDTWNLFASFNVKCECQKMAAGPRVCYAWESDSGEMERVTAQEYKQLALRYARAKLLKARDAPMYHCDQHAEEFRADMVKLYKRLFRVFAHQYLHHFEEVRASGSEATLNFCFKHLLYVALEFHLLSDTDMLPLKDLISAFIERDRINDSPFS